MSAPDNNGDGRAPHWIGPYLRGLRNKAGLSLDQFRQETGMPTAVIGSYERCERRITVARADDVLRFYGRQLTVVPLGMDVAGMVAELEELRRFKRLVVEAVTAAEIDVK
jgi:transcriptional regulator with XRE-family HTH domain